MLNDNNRDSFNHDNRNLSDVFRELQESRYSSNANNGNIKKKKSPKVKKNFAFSSHVKNYNNHSDLKLSHIVTGCAIVIVGMALIFPKNFSLTESYAKEENLLDTSEYEINRHRLNIQNIISENVDMDKIKEQVTEERDVEFETEYSNNASLPKGEEILIQEGALGKDNVTAVKTYQNGELVEEVILKKEKLVEPIVKKIDLGTSEFLAKHKVHIGDTMFFVNDVKLKKEMLDSSEDVAEIVKHLDVVLLELHNEEWCKVSFDNIEGYVKTSDLTSSAVTPNIIEKNRVQRLLIKVNIDMELNKPSKLTLNDYKKIFTGLSSDRNRVFQNNYTAFYNAEKKYNINGIFLASIAVHESGWGSSQIAQDKNNLFGYGSYDATPYESSFEFADYSEGIDTVAKSLVKYYLNPVGTKIYGGETAAATYYNGPTLMGVNTRYATDKEWHTKVYKHMEMLYNRL